MVKRKNFCSLCPPDVRGLCCYESVFVKGVQIVVDHHCEFFDDEARKCTVFKERFERAPWCLTVEEMKKLGTLPRKCPYVQFDQAYQARTDLRLYFDEFEIVKK